MLHNRGHQNNQQLLRVSVGISGDLHHLALHILDDGRGHGVCHCPKQLLSPTETAKCLPGKDHVLAHQHCLAGVFSMGLVRGWPLTLYT